MSRIGKVETRDNSLWAHLHPYIPRPNKKAIVIEDLREKLIIWGAGGVKSEGVTPVFANHRTDHKPIINMESKEAYQRAILFLDTAHCRRKSVTR